MAYYADIEFLKEAMPGLVERNSDEFMRMHELLESVKPSVRKTKDETKWEGAGRERYDARLGDVSGLVDALSGAFAKAAGALRDYAPALAEAQQAMREGKVTEQKLADEISKVAVAITRTAQQAEPMQQWEDIRATTGILDWIVELGMNVDSIRADAERFYEQTKHSFEVAKKTEENARRACLAELHAGYTSYLTSVRMSRTQRPS